MVTELQLDIIQWGFINDISATLVCIMNLPPGTRQAVVSINDGACVYRTLKVGALHSGRNTDFLKQSQNYSPFTYMELYLELLFMFCYACIPFVLRYGMKTLFHCGVNKHVLTWLDFETKLSLRFAGCDVLSWLNTDRSLCWSGASEGTTLIHRSHGSNISQTLCHMTFLVI